MGGEIPKDLTTMKLITANGEETIHLRFLAKGAIGSVFLEVDSNPPRLFKIVDSLISLDDRESYQHELAGASLLFIDSPPQDYECRIEYTDASGENVVIKTHAYTMPLIPSNGVSIGARNKDNDFADPSLHDMPLFQRLKVFDDLAQQIQHLHHKGAIMPDLKSLNVIFCGVKASPYMRLIDGGGIAKLDDIAKSVAKRQQRAPLQRVDVDYDKLGIKKPPPKLSFTSRGQKKQRDWETWFSAWKENNGINQDFTFEQAVAFFTSPEHAVPDIQDIQESQHESSDTVVTDVIPGFDFGVSPQTITPEICRDDGQQSIGKPSDIYNLGRILFILLGGDIDDTYLDSPLIKKVKPFTEMEKVVKDLFERKFGMNLSDHQRTLQNLLISCFKEEPSARPSIETLRSALGDLMQANASVQEILNSALTLTEKVDWLLTTLANRGPTPELLDALKVPEIAAHISTNPLHFYQFFKTIYHLRSEQVENIPLFENETINGLLSRGAQNPQNQYAIFKAICLLQGMGKEVSYSLDSLGLTNEKQGEFAIKILIEFSKCEGVYDALCDSEFFKGPLRNIELFVGSNFKGIADPLEFVSRANAQLVELEKETLPGYALRIVRLTQTVLCEQQCVANINSDNVDSFSQTAPAYIFSQLGLFVAAVKLLQRPEKEGILTALVEKTLCEIYNPIVFTQKAKSQLDELKKAKVDESILEKIALLQAKICANQCSIQLNIDNLAEFIQNAPPVMIHLVLVKKLDNPGDNTFMGALSKRKDLIAGLLGQHPELDKILYSTQHELLLPAMKDLQLENIEADYKHLKTNGNAIKFVEEASMLIQKYVGAGISDDMLNDIKKKQVKYFEKNILKKIDADNIARFIHKAPTHFLVVAAIRSKVIQLLSTKTISDDDLKSFVEINFIGIQDPVVFAKQAELQLNAFAASGAQLEVLRIIQTKQALLCEQLCLKQITLGNIAQFINESPSHFLVSPAIESEVIKLLSTGKISNDVLKAFIKKSFIGINDPVEFAKQAEFQLNTFKDFGTKLEVLRITQTNQALLCEKQCLNQITIRNVVEFTEAAPSHVLTRLALHRKLVAGGDQHFIDELSAHPTYVDQLLKQDPRLARILFLTKVPTLLPIVRSQFAFLLKNDELSKDKLEILLKSRDIKEIVIQNPRLMMQCKQALGNANFNEVFSETERLQATKTLLKQARLTSHGLSSQPRHAQEIIKEKTDYNDAVQVIEATGVNFDKFKTAAANLQGSAVFGRDNLTTAAYCIAAFILREDLPPTFTVQALQALDNESRLFQTSAPMA